MWKIVWRILLRCCWWYWFFFLFWLGWYMWECLMRWSCFGICREFLVLKLFFCRVVFFRWWVGYFSFVGYDLVMESRWICVIGKWCCLCRGIVFIVINLIWCWNSWLDSMVFLCFFILLMDRVMMCFLKCCWCFLMWCRFFFWIFWWLFWLCFWWM